MDTAEVILSRAGFQAERRISRAEADVSGRSLALPEKAQGLGLTPSKKRRRG